MLVKLQTNIVPSADCTLRITAVSGLNNGQTQDRKYVAAKTDAALFPAGCDLPAWVAVDEIELQIVKPKALGHFVWHRSRQLQVCNFPSPLPRLRRQACFCISTDLAADTTTTVQNGCNIIMLRCELPVSSQEKSS